MSKNKSTSANNRDDNEENNKTKESNINENSGKSSGNRKPSESLIKTDSTKSIPTKSQQQNEQVNQNHPCARRRTEHGAEFSSNQCPPTAGLENSCELPFGCIISPMSINKRNAVVIDSSSSIQNQPIVCTACLSYFNLYAEVMNQGAVWICPLCNTMNAVPMDCLNLLGLCMSSPIVEYHYKITEKPSSLGYILVIDENLTKEEIETIKNTFHTYITKQLQQKRTVLLGLITFSSNVSIYQVGLSGIASANIYSMEKSQITSELKERSFLGYDAIGSTTLYQCLTAIGSSKKSSLQSDVFEEKKQEDFSSRRDYLLYKSQTQRRGRKKKKEKKRCTGAAMRFATNLASCLAQSNEEEGSSCPARILLFTNGCPNHGVGNLTRKNDIIDPMAMQMGMEYYKDVGIQAFQNDGVGIDVFCSGGTSSLGIPAFLTLVSASGGYALPHTKFDTDQFVNNLSHSLEFSYMSYCNQKQDKAAASSGGFGGMQMQDEYESMEEEELNQLSLNGCCLDIRTPSFLESTHIIGPGDEIYNFEETEEGVSPYLLPHDIPAFLAALERSESYGFPNVENMPDSSILASTLNRIQIGRYDPLSTYSMIFRTLDSELPSEAVFQFIIRYMSDDGGTIITRVYTHKLPVSQDVEEFVKGVDEEIMPVLLGREAVHRCCKIGLELSKEMEEVLSQEARKDLDLTIHRISTMFRKIGSERFDTDYGLESNYSGVGNLVNQSSEDFAFPPELSTALQLLFHLRRGPLLDVSLYSSEDRSSLRSLFLRLPLHDCFQLMSPNLWCVRMVLFAQNSTSHELIPVPPETLVLWDNVVIACDTFDSLFIWSGRATKNANLQAEYKDILKEAQEHLTSNSYLRFPQPERIMFNLNDGDSMSRHFTCRLVPTHLDPPDYQIAHFPDLTLLNPQEMMGLRGKFRFFGDASGVDEVRTFRRWFWNVASVANNSKIEGNSLCD